MVALIAQVLFHNKHFSGGGIALSGTQCLVEAAQYSKLDLDLVPFHVACLVLVIRHSVVGSARKLADLGQFLEPFGQPQLQLFGYFAWVAASQPHANNQLGSLLEEEGLATFPVMHSPRSDFQEEAARG
eukprot:4572876-Prorocentrum_lima.AAC.1